MNGLGALGKFFADHVYSVVLFGTLVDATGVPFPGRIALTVVALTLGVRLWRRRRYGHARV